MNNRKNKKRIKDKAIQDKKLKELQDMAFLVYQQRRKEEDEALLKAGRKHTDGLL